MGMGTLEARKAFSAKYLHNNRTHEDSMGYSVRVSAKPILESEDVVVHLNRGEKGEDMLEVAFRTEHGWSRPKVMSLENWQRIAFSADSILAACDKISEVKERARKLAARKAEHEDKVATIEKSRSIFGHEAANMALTRLKAQYPEFYPAEEETPAETADRETAEELSGS
jgi:hypothetical protein